MTGQVIPLIGELPEIEAPIDLKDAGLTQREALLSVADDVDLWRTPEGETYASCTVDDHIEHHAVASKAFRDFLLAGVARKYTSNGRPASVGENTVRDARQAIEARAYQERVCHKADLRVVEHQNGVYIDRGTEDWSALAVDGGGWRIVPQPPVPIVRSRRTAPLATPVIGADFGPLRQLLGRLAESDFTLFVAWCLGALSPSGPYPVLIFGGEQGSGKSTLARLAQRIVDPVAGDLLQPPGDDRDLIAAARNGRVLAFDNISSIKPDMADSICRLATGAEIGGRALFTNHDSASFAACRPIILNGIPDLAARGDLADRSIVIRLGQLDGRVTEKDFWLDVERALPSVMAALLDAFVVGLKRLEDVQTPDVRMADFARLVAAAEPSLPWAQGAFLKAYAANRAEAVAAIVEGDMVASRVLEFARSNGDAWSGLKSELYRLLSAEAPIEAKRSGDWPGNVRWFSDRLTRAAPALRALGYDVVSGRHGNTGTEVHIRNLASLASLVSRLASQSKESTGPGAPNGDASDASDATRLVSQFSPGLSEEDLAYLRDGYVAGR